MELCVRKGKGRVEKAVNKGKSKRNEELSNNFLIKLTTFLLLF